MTCYPFEQIFAVLQFMLTKGIKFIIYPFPIPSNPYQQYSTRWTLLHPMGCNTHMVPQPQLPFNNTQEPPLLHLQGSQCAEHNQLELKQCQEQVEQFFIQGSEEPFNSCNFSESRTGWGSATEEAHWWRPHWHWWHWHRQGSKGGVCYRTSVLPPPHLCVLCHMPPKVLTTLQCQPDISHSL